MATDPSYHQLYKMQDTSTLDILAFLDANNDRIAHRNETVIFSEKQRELSEQDREAFYDMCEREVHAVVKHLDSRDIRASGIKSSKPFYYERKELQASNDYNVIGYAGKGYALYILLVDRNISNAVLYYSLDETNRNDVQLRSKLNGMVKTLREANKALVPVVEEKARVHMLKQGGSGNLFFEATEFNWNKHPNADVEDFYEEDFGRIKGHILSELNKDKNPGLVLLHGKHGTGKTTLMKIIIEESSKPVLFLPPQITRNITMPGLIDAITGSFKEPIVLVEDAEALLMKRRADENAMSVANMLNLGDGILGNIYNMKFVCTFNCDIEEIDPAARRPGRLIAEYQFDDLSEARTLKLYQKLHGAGKCPPRLRMSIAEIINDEKEKVVTETKKQKFGFIQG